MSKQVTSQHKKRISPRATQHSAMSEKAQKVLKANHAPAKIDPDTRYALIAETAYYRAERRGFIPGSEVQDWLEAEAEIEAMLQAKTPH